MKRVESVEMSSRTFVVLWAGFGLFVVLALLGLAITLQFPAGSVIEARSVVSDVGSIGFGVLASAFLCFAGLRFPARSALRRIWMLLGIGVGLYAIGDIIWIYLETTSAFGVPYPSVADVFYLSTYVFMGAGLLRAVKAFGRATYTEGAVRADVLMMFFACVGVYTFVVAPILVDSGSTLVVKVLSAVYPIGDLVVLLGPALFIAVVASSVGRAQAGWHWVALSAGLAVMAIADIAFAWLDWTGRYSSGSPVDYAWMLSLLLIAVAGSLAADACVGRCTVTAPVPLRRVGAELAGGLAAASTMVAAAESDYAASSLQADADGLLDGLVAHAIPYKSFRYVDG